MSGRCLSADVAMPSALTRCFDMIKAVLSALLASLVLLVMAVGCAREVATVPPTEVPTPVPATATPEPTATQPPTPTPTVPATAEPTHTPEPTATRFRRPTPTPSPEWSPGASSPGQIWDERWIEFTEEPEVCDGVLRFKGMAKGGARVSYEANEFLPFVLYVKAELAPRPGFALRTVPPIMGFLQPMPDGSYYPPLDVYTIEADVLVTPRNGEFQMVGEWPSWRQPGEIALGVWGYRPNDRQDNLRLAEVESCNED